MSKTLVVVNGHKEYMDKYTVGRLRKGTYIVFNQERVHTLDIVDGIKHVWTTFIHYDNNIGRYIAYKSFPDDRGRHLVKARYVITKKQYRKIKKEEEK